MPALVKTALFFALIHISDFVMGQTQGTVELALRLERWIEKNAHPIKNAMNPGVDTVRLDALEKTLQCHLPQAVRGFYLQSDGQKDHLGGVFEGEELLSTDRILSEWKAWRTVMEDSSMKDLRSSPDAGVKNDWWNAKWIPITYDGHGNHYCLDLDPAAGGQVGQIIRMWHDGPERELVSSSFESWMLDYVTALEAGNFVYSDEIGGIVTKEEASEYER